MRRRLCCRGVRASRRQHGLHTHQRQEPKFGFVITFTAARAPPHTWKSTVACGTYALRLTKSMAFLKKSWMAGRSNSAGEQGRQHHR